MSNSVRPHRRQPTRMPRPWDSPGKNTGVGCHFLLQCMKVKSESEVAQSCLTLSDPWTAAYQAPLSMGFSRQEYWSRVPLPSPITLYVRQQKRHRCKEQSFGLCGRGGWFGRMVLKHVSDQIRSVAQSCLTLCNLMNRSRPGLPVHHQLPEFTETHVHRVSDAIQPSHPLSSPSPLAPNPSQHQSLFQWVNSLHEVAKVLEFQL